MATKTKTSSGVKGEEQFGGIAFSVSDSQSLDVVRVIFTQADFDELVLEKGEKTILLGIGKKEMTRRAFMLLPRRIVSFAKAHRVAHLFIDTQVFLAVVTSDEIAPAERVELFVTNAEMANFSFVQYKKVPEGGWKTVQSVVFGNVGEYKKVVTEAIVRGKIVSHAVNHTRILVNIPGGEMTPKVLVEKAKNAVAGTSVKLSVLGRAEMKKLGMGGVLGVAQGSDEEPQFLILEYKGGAAKEQPLLLVGKGITFDSGGLNLKPSSAIYEMHMDMSGGAAVIASIVAAAKLGVKKNIVALVPAAENMPSGSSYRPGDILRTMSGITIEITNTDAEGRVVLSDALTYAERYNPRLVIDVATLTGAAVVALGTRASAIFSKNEDLIQTVRKMGEASGEYVWPLPLWDEYEGDIKSTFADIVNSGKSRYGGSIEGAMFLYQFTKKYPKGTDWLHIDMAPRMTPNRDEYLAEGASGAPVRLLIHLLENY